MRTYLVVIAAALSFAVSCGSAGTDQGLPLTATLELTAVAGPTCPVQADPPVGECDPRPVENATVIVTDVDGVEVARGVTGADGVATIAVPSGPLVVVPRPAEGMMGTAGTVDVTAVDGETLQLTLDYDTGIR